MSHNNEIQYSPDENFAETLLSSMRKQNGSLMNLHVNMAHQHEENKKTQKEIDTKTLCIETNTISFMDDVRMLHSTNELVDKIHVLAKMSKALLRIEDDVATKRYAHNKSVTNQQRGQETLTEYHAVLNHLLHYNFEICEENIKAIREVQKTKQEMNELHEAMKRMVDAHAHNLTTRPDATPRRRGFFGMRKDVQSCEQYVI